MFLRRFGKSERGEIARENLSLDQWVCSLFWSLMVIIMLGACNSNTAEIVLTPSSVAVYQSDNAVEVPVIASATPERGSPMATCTTLPTETRTAVPTATREPLSPTALPTIVPSATATPIPSSPTSRPTNTASPTTTTVPPSPTAAPTHTPIPSATAELPTPTPLLPTVTLTPTGQYGLPAEVQVVRAQPMEGQFYWRLVDAVYEDGSSARSLPGDHHIYVRLLKLDDSTIADYPVFFSWDANEERVMTSNAAAPFHGTAEWGMSAGLGTYACRVGDVSDAVIGLGLPEGQQVSYILTFKYTLNTPHPYLPVDWDMTLPSAIRLLPANVPSGTPFWHLTRIEYEDVHEGKTGITDHNIYTWVYDEYGNHLSDHAVIFRWGSGEHIASSIGMYGQLGSYSCQVDEHSDVVSGMGLPANHHVQYLLTFQRVIQP